MSELPARHVSLAGASNFRDLGGYPASDGRIVRWRQIFRSNHLGRLTEDDIAMVRSLGVRSAFDFRGMEERNEALCGIADIAVHSLPVEPTVVASLRAIAASGTKLQTTFGRALTIRATLTKPVTQWYLAVPQRQGPWPAT